MLGGIGRDGVTHIKKHGLSARLFAIDELHIHPVPHLFGGEPPSEPFVLSETIKYVSENHSSFAHFRELHAAYGARTDFGDSNFLLRAHLDIRHLGYRL
jgi:hypothetical protein